MRKLVLLLMGVLALGELTYAQCETFESAAKGSEALEAHSLYRELFKQKNYDEAFPLWQKAHGIAPAANGKTTRHFRDGVTLHLHYFNNSDDEAKKRQNIKKPY